MKKLFLVLVGLMLTTLPFATHAHEFETDETISGFIHIEPNDTPIVGDVSTIALHLKAENTVVNATFCTCEVTFMQPNTEMTKQTLPADGTIPYTFTSAGTYTMTVSGNSTAGADFAPFTLTFPIRVVKSRFQALIFNPHIFHYGGTGIAAVFVLGYIAQDQFKKWRGRSKKKT
jgi:hypothetical protein